MSSTWSCGESSMLCTVDKCVFVCTNCNSTQVATKLAAPAHADQLNNLWRVCSCQLRQLLVIDCKNTLAPGTCKHDATVFRHTILTDFYSCNCSSYALFRATRRATCKQNSSYRTPWRLPAGWSLLSMQAIPEGPGQQYLPMSATIQHSSSKALAVIVRGTITGERRAASLCVACKRSFSCPCRQVSRAAVGICTLQ
jgi:hypothetical protein